MNNAVKFESWAVAWGTILGMLMSFVAPVAPFIILSVVLILADWHTGVRAARKSNEVIHSKGFARSVDKLTIYLILILCSEGIRIVFFKGFEQTVFPYVAEFPITYIAAFAICIREFKSISENAYKITGLDVWALIADRIETMFSLFTKKKNDDNTGTE